MISSTFDFSLDLQTGFSQIFGLQEHIFHVFKENNSSEMLRADFHHIISIGAGILLTFKHVRCQRPESYLSSHWLLAINFCLMTILIYFPHINVIQTYIQGLQRYLTFQNTYFMFLNKKNSSEMLRADFHHRQIDRFIFANTRVYI